MNSYTYSGSWPNHGQYQPADQQQPQQSHQQPQQHHQQQPLPHSPYSRQSVYGHANPMSFPRSSQSPATNISASPFDQTQQHYTHDAMTGAPQHSGLVAPVSQSSMHASLPAHADAYAHTRPGSNPSYYTTSGPSQFPSYPPHSPNQPSPTTGSPGARGVNSVANGPSGPYRYGHFPLPNMGTNHGTIMSNMHHPGGQMSMIPGMGHHHAYGAGPVASYSQAAQPQSERPFKCDQCIQSFSRNHDLKRHKRIHLAVKPFPCNYCSKSFSRKDALKVRTLLPAWSSLPSASLDL